MVFPVDRRIGLFRLVRLSTLCWHYFEIDDRRARRLSTPTARRDHARVDSTPVLPSAGLFPTDTL